MLSSAAARSASPESPSKFSFCRPIVGVEVSWPYLCFSEHSKRAFTYPNASPTASYVQPQLQADGTFLLANSGSKPCGST